MKKTVKNILVLCLSMVLFSMTGPLVCGCKPESKDNPEYPEPGPDPEPTPEPGKLASVLTMKIGDLHHSVYGRIVAPIYRNQEGRRDCPYHKS